jgi:hypothetical protein
MWPRCHIPFPQTRGDYNNVTTTSRACTIVTNEHLERISLQITAWSAALMSAIRDVDTSKKVARILFL